VQTSLREKALLRLTLMVVSCLREATAVICKAEGGGVEVWNIEGLCCPLILYAAGDKRNDVEIKVRGQMTSSIAGGFAMRNYVDRFYVIISTFSGRISKDPTSIPQRCLPCSQAFFLISALK